MAGAAPAAATPGRAGPARRTLSRVPTSSPSPSTVMRSHGTGLAVAATGVALATLAVEALDEAAPVVSLGVLYVLPVLLVATRDGALLAAATAVASILAFNWFHLLPTGRLTLAESRDWAVLAVLLVVAVSAARIAERGRRSAAGADAAREETELVAELSCAVLLGPSVAAALDDAALRLSRAVGVPVTLRPWRPGDTEAPGEILLSGPGGPVAALRAGSGLDTETATGLRERLAPALAAAVTAGVERERLARQAVEAAALRRSNEVATTLLRTVGHDLRTPLTQISVAAAALGSSSISAEERRELAVGISEGSDRLGDLIGKLLDLSRLEAGAAAPRPDDVPLDDIVRDALQDMTRTHPEVAAVRVLSTDPPPRARVDPVQIARIVSNLVENALVHGRDPSTGALDVLVRVATRKDRAVVRVIDAGPGLDPRARDELFLPFRRGDAAPGAGSGLGLAIARGFAEANGGSLRVESYAGRGCSFVLELPTAGGRSPDPGRPERDVRRTGPA